MKTIGLLTSGGDAPGMNACIATISSLAEKHGVHLRGIIGGFQGLVQGNSIPIGCELSGLARRGGSFLGTARKGNIEEELAQRKAADVMNRLGVDGLVVMGGGGSMEGTAALAAEGVKVVGVPCTIDNDIFGTDYSIGFDSAVNKAVRAADEILDTAESLSERIFFIETLGGITGHIALATAYATGADAAIIPEFPIDITALANKIKEKMDAGGTHGPVIITENLGTSDIAEQIHQLTGRRDRITILGHTMRGGTPTYFDRAIARSFGESAFDMLISGESGKMVTHSCGSIGAIELSETAGKSRKINSAIYNTVMGV